MITSLLSPLLNHLLSLLLNYSMKIAVCILLTITIFCLSPISAQNVLSAADFTAFQTSGYVFASNFAGISLNFSQIYTAAINSTLFQGLIANSRAFGSFISVWPLSVKVQSPTGFKYNCTAYTAMNISATCVFSYSASNSRMTAFARAVAPISTQQSVIGFDMEKANFSNPNFFSYFTSYLSTMYTVMGNNLFNQPIELFDGADTFSARGILPNYTASSFVNDMNLALTSGATLFGPGISQAADDSWMATYDAFRSNPNVWFTVKAVVFNQSTPTIEDILNQTNYRNFILKRFTYNGIVLNPAGGKLVITQMKLVEGPGINGVTNSFAAALWAIDISIEFAMFGGRGIKFPIDISTGNFQTLIGPAPTYAVTPLYLGLLFLSSLNYANAQVGMPAVTAGSSSRIKIYGFVLGSQLQVVMLNKDTNASASGVVNLTINSKEAIKCLYLSAPALQATSGVTWMGYNFINGNSTPQGTYRIFFYNNVAENLYQIPLNCSQAALCYLGNPATAFTTAYKSGPKLTLSLLVLLILAIIIW